MNDHVRTISDEMARRLKEQSENKLQETIKLIFHKTDLEHFISDRFSECLREQMDYEILGIGENVIDNDTFNKLVDEYYDSKINED
jgi:uncharacterized membrane protein YheB (UPF0754 family)